MTSLESEEYGSEIARLRAQLDEGTFKSAWAEGRQMTADQAVAFALSE
jgi:hypothetical protein